ncbi:DUF1254 domain-containing protein [Kitasatospora sp. NPDC001540]|uniref:DUF1254 domain-containing protein n=1 Tax=Kitasatospora sp. NPDC001540 TaxID=3364014 RepID=UPI00367AB5F7
MMSDDLQTLAREAYVYLYPLVTMDVTRHQAVSAPPGTKPVFGPPNEFHHLREFPSAEFRSVVRPNFDTLYSSAWLDLREGPVQLHVSDTGGRYFMVPLLDMWTDVFATLGPRTTGSGDQDYLVVGPDHRGELPVGAKVLHSPTPYAWVIGRIQTNGPADYEKVRRIQDGLVAKALHPVEHRVDPTVDAVSDPLATVNGFGAVEFFTRAARALAVNPPHPTDFSVLARIAALGIVPGREFDPARFSDAETAALEAGVRSAREAVNGPLAAIAKSVNGWRISTETMGVYGNAYFKRAAVAAIGLGANPPEDAIYPVLTVDADGRPVTGEHDYLLHFPADGLPPVQAFWSVTMYDAQGFQVANEIDRFALGDRDPLTYHADGSLDLLISHRDPGPERRANWLPAPNGPLGLTLRLYAPRPEALDGRWSPPAVRRIG